MMPCCTIPIQTEIAKRLNAICAQVIPFLSQEHQQQVAAAVERAKQVTTSELHAIIGVRFYIVLFEKTVAFFQNHFILLNAQMNQQHFPAGVMPPFVPMSATGGAPLVPPPFNNPALLAAYQQQGAAMAGVSGSSTGGSSRDKDDKREDEQVSFDLC